MTPTDASARLAALTREAEAAAFLVWAAEDGQLGPVDLQLATRLVAERAPDAPFWEALAGELELEPPEPDPNGVTFRCPPCELELELPPPLGRYVPRCPACGVGGDDDTASGPAPLPAPGATPEPAPELSEQAFIRWAVEVKGVDPLALEQAQRKTDMSLFEALVFHGDIALDDAMRVLVPPVGVSCRGCGEASTLGRGLLDYLSALRCPACGGELARTEATGPARLPADAPRIGDYRVGPRLGDGGMAEVFLAYDPEGRAVAIKVLSAIRQAVDHRRFEREGRLLGRLDHPNVVRILGNGVDEESGRAYLVLELIHGQDLQALIASRPKERLDPLEVAYIIERCARALGYAHSLGVIHRDVKPGNILSTADGEIKLTDFGIALTQNASQRLTDVDEIVGTPEYIPPEAVLAQAWTPAADVYALGACAYRLIAGEHAYDERDPLEILKAHASKPPRPLQDRVRDVPAALAELVMAMLRRDPRARPSASQVAERLGNLAPATSQIARLWSEAATHLRHGGSQTPPPLRREVTLSTGQTFHHYKIDRELGRGGMGAVYRARHERLGKQVALKILLSGSLASDEERRRFLREAEAAAALQHPYLVPVIDVGEHDGTYFLTMEYVEGLPLDAYARQGFGLQPLLQLFTRICEGVAHAHSRGIIHRDLKPDNVLVDERETPRILDFGIAKRIDQEEEQALTTEGDMIGTVRYMPPEQAAGRLQDVDVRSDVYALGSMLYELACGRTPFRGPTRQVLHQLHFVEPAPPSKYDPTLPWELDAICLKALEKERDARYQSVLELRQDLERFLSGRPVLARRATVFYRLRKWVARNQRQAAVAALLLVSLGAVLAAWGAETLAAEERRQAAIREDAARGWALLGARQFERAADRFQVAAHALRPGEVLELDAGVPRSSGQLRRQLSDEEQGAPRIHRDRLEAWGALARAQGHTARAEPHLWTAREACARGGLAEARQELGLAAAFAGPDDPELRRVAWHIGRGYLARARTALEREAQLARSEFGARAQALDAARLALEAARGLDPRGPALGGLIELAERRRRLGEDREQLTRLQASEERLAEAEASRREAQACGERGARRDQIKHLERARLLLTGAFELEAAREAYTRVLLDLGWCHLAAGKLELVAAQLDYARLHGLLPDEIARLEAARALQDETERTFQRHVERGDAYLLTGDWHAAREAFRLALAAQEDPEVRRRFQRCSAELEVQVALEAAQLKRARAALLRLRALGGSPEAELERVNGLLFAEAFAAAQEAMGEAARSGSGWGAAAEAFEAALEYRPGDPRALRGRGDAYARRELPPGMILVSVPTRLLSREAVEVVNRDEGVTRFYLGEREVSNAEYAAFVREGYSRGEPAELWTTFVDETGLPGPRGWSGGAPPPGTEQEPVTGICWVEARAYAEWAGSRLPTSEEWAAAACFTPEGAWQAFPWGDRITPTQLERLRRRGRRSDGLLDRSPWGALDMGFGVSEWTATPGELPEARVVRGLSFASIEPDLSAGVRAWQCTPRATFRDTMVGLRLARSVAGPR